MTKKFIIVSENGKPMTFHKLSKQLCFVTTNARSRFYLKLYTRQQAERHIRTTITNRTKWGMYRDESYKLMRVKA